MPARLASKEPLSYDRVVEAALAVADADGLSGLTMRRVSEVLDCEPMTLYYYVGDKAGLLTAISEAVVTEVVDASLGTDRHTPPMLDWRRVVRQRCLEARVVMLAHPWAPALITSQHAVPAGAFAIFEALVAAMVDDGCTDDLAHRAIHALGSMLFGFTQELFEPAAGDPDTTEEDFEGMAHTMPNLARLAASITHETPQALGLCDTQSEFEFTLDLILNALETHRLKSAHTT